MLSTTLIKPIVLNLLTIKPNIQTIIYIKTTQVTNEIIVVKKFAYADDIISAKVLDVCDDSCSVEYNEELFKNKFVNQMPKDDIIYNDKCTKIFYKDKFIDFPFQTNIHQLEKEEFIESTNLKNKK